MNKLGKTRGNDDCIGKSSVRSFDLCFFLTVAGKGHAAAPGDAGHDGRAAVGAAVARRRDVGGAERAAPAPHRPAAPRPARPRPPGVPAQARLQPPARGGAAARPTRLDRRPTRRAHPVPRPFFSFT